MMIIKQAQGYFRKEGIDQWQNNYPNLQVIKEDIENGYLHVLIMAGRIVAVASISFDGEETYENIYEGAWIYDGDYAVIHRLAVADDYKGFGVASRFIAYAVELCLKGGVKSIRIDTHEENMSMQKMLNKNGFQYSGIIYLKDGSKRLAYEKIL